MKYQIINTYAAATETERENARFSASRQIYRELLRYNESRGTAEAPSVPPVGKTARTQAEGKSARKSA